MPEPILRAEGVSKRFGGLMAIEGVDLDVHAGEVLGLIGPNGSGKTTLVNVVTGLVPITGGRVLFEGRDITGWPAHRIVRLGIARTFQVVKPFRSLAVRENVAVGAMFGAEGVRRRMPEVFARVDEVLEIVGLRDQADQPADSLTLAGLKRLELAKALALGPRLLFLDEVMAGLNATETAEAMALIRRVSASGVTLVVIEHVMQAILGVCGRVAALHNGRKIADAAPEEVLRHPEVVAAYLGRKWAERC